MLTHSLIQRPGTAITFPRRRCDLVQRVKRMGAFRLLRWKPRRSTKSKSGIAKNEGLHHSVVNELMRLTLLAPNIITQLMSGTQPRRLNLMWFQRNRLPVAWEAQLAIIDGFK